MDDRDNTQPELPALLAGPVRALPEKGPSGRGGKTLERTRPDTPELGYDPYNSVA